MNRYSRNFKDVPAKKLFYINNITQLPLDVINIIKSFCFIDLKSANLIHYIQERKIFNNLLIKIAHSRNTLYNQEESDWPVGLNTDSSFWIFGFDNNLAEYQNRYMIQLIEEFGYSEPLNHHYQVLRCSQNLQLQGENCHLCGEYTYLAYSKYRNIPSNLPLCSCQEN